MNFFDDVLNILEGEEFEERPVDVEEFVQSKDFLGLPPLSDYQYTMVKAMTQIYKKSTLINLYGEETGEARWKQTMNEIILQLGKGSGKDYTSTIACAYVVYLLLCLNEPAEYYGKPPGDSIDIINIAINAQQASNVFFKGFTQRIERSPWFAGKYEKKQGHVSFDKSINVYSGHSEREAWEGYNVIFVVLDEISGFALESTSGNEQSKTAEAVYKMYRGSVDSRFPEFGKVALLSFPRFRGDFIQQRYNSVIAEKEIIQRSHKFKLDPDLPDGNEDNEFEINWEEDHIISYIIPRVFALKRPTWEVNPIIKLDSLISNFFLDPIDALSRFACMPPDAIDAFFKDRQKVELSFSGLNGVDEFGRFEEHFVPRDETRYFIHVDLAKKHDHCAVALSHVDKWVRQKIGSQISEVVPVIKVDAIRWWTPTKDKNVDFDEVRQYIVMLQQRGFDLKLVTFDRWESDDMIRYLNSVGIKAERLSVAKRHYQDFSTVLHDERLSGPNIKLLKDELLSLRIMPNDKIDHPRKGSKDLADAVCGSIYNSIAHTPRSQNEIIDIMTWDNVKTATIKSNTNDGVIRAPSLQMPEELSSFLAAMKVI